MRILTLLLFFWVVLHSCQTRQHEKVLFNLLLSECDEIDISYFNSNDTIVCNVHDISSIKTLTGLITGESESISDTCSPSGQIVFKRHGQKIFLADFSTTNSNKKSKCDYLTYLHESKAYSHRLTYNAGMLIDELYWEKLRLLDRTTLPE